MLKGRISLDFISYRRQEIAPGLASTFIHPFGLPLSCLHRPIKIAEAQQMARKGKKDEKVKLTTILISFTFFNLIACFIRGFLARSGNVNFEVTVIAVLCLPTNVSFDCSFVIEEHRWLIIGYWELIKQPNVSKLRSYTYRMYGILCSFLSPPKLLFYLIIINYFWYSTINNVSQESSLLTGLLFVCIYLITFPLSKHTFYLFFELYSYVCDRIVSLRTIVFLCTLGLFLMILDVDFEEEGIEKVRSKRNKFILYNVWYFFHYIIIDLKICNEVKGEQIYTNSMSTLLQNLLYKICSNVKRKNLRYRKFDVSPIIYIYIH